MYIFTCLIMIWDYESIKASTEFQFDISSKKESVSLCFVFTE
jgi:hypothetical protein